MRMRYHPPPRPPPARRMTGILGVRNTHTPDGDKQVETVLPNDQRFTLPPEAALQFAFALLVAARNCFASQEALDAAVPVAHAASRDLLLDQRRPQ